MLLISFYWSGGNVSLLSINITEELLLLSDCCSRSRCSLSLCCLACCLLIACCARCDGDNTFVCDTTGTWGWTNLFFIICWWFVGDISSRDLFERLSCSSLSSDSEISSELILDRLKPWLSLLNCIEIILDDCIMFGSVVVMMIPRFNILGSQETFIQFR